MTKNIIIVPGSVRPTSVARELAKRIDGMIKQREDLKAKVVDLGELDLPFFDNPIMPAHPDFKVENDNVKQWTKLVAEADGVLFVSPEYNHTISAVQKNAIDWINDEWKDKPVASVSFGFGGGKLSLENIKEALGNLKANFLDSEAQLYLTKDLDVDGTPLDDSLVDHKINDAIDKLANA